MTKKKTLKIAAALTALVLLGILLWVAQGLLGNPLSRLLADRAAAEYLAETYPDLDLKAEKAYYSFKTSGYYVQVASPTSVDTHFSLAYNPWGKLQYDSYESSVTGGWNTWERLESEYRQMVDSVFSAPDFPFESEIDFGTLSSVDVEVNGPPGAAPPMDSDSLVLDKPYDMEEIGAQYGEIVFYLREEGEPNLERALEVLLILKERLDAAGVKFYDIDLVLQQPRSEDATDSGQLNVGKVSSADLESEDRLARVEAASEAITAYYARMDGEKLEQEAIDT